jgi:hypothetical protein
MTMKKSQKNSDLREENSFTEYDSNDADVFAFDEEAPPSDAADVLEKDIQRKKWIKRISLVVILVLFCAVYFGIPWGGERWSFEEALSFIPNYIFWGYLILFGGLLNKLIGKSAGSAAASAVVVLTVMYLVGLVISIMYVYAKNRWFLFILLMLLLLAFPYVGCAIFERGFRSAFN